ncbi:MAG: hypothetical protein ABIQ88_11525 [Chitinophagaceae bacterium]
MKKIISIMLTVVVIAWLPLAVSGQDSTKQSAIKKINADNEHADNLQGKKIQQQALAGKTFEKLDTVAANSPKKKKHAVTRRKHS